MECETALVLARSRTSGGTLASLFRNRCHWVVGRSATSGEPTVATEDGAEQEADIGHRHPADEARNQRRRTVANPATRNKIPAVPS